MERGATAVDRVSELPAPQNGPHIETFVQFDCGYDRAHALKKHSDRVLNAPFSADGQRVVTASWEPTSACLSHSHGGRHRPAACLEMNHRNSP